ncbi:MAG: methyltransferase domain-containing protein [Myxococcota bacterium]
MPNDSYQDVYASDADRYDAMVSAEDAEQNLPKTLARVLVGARRVIDIGCGTGRVTRAIIAATGAQVVGVEPAPAMLEVARRRSPGTTFLEGPADALPVADRSFDAAVAGWVFGHQVSWAGERWPDTIGKFLDEMRRVVRPGGTLVVIETLGTGRGEEPEPPSPASGAYYDWLEARHGFTRHAIDTSYRYDSVDQAVAGMAFFFGSRLAERIRQHGWTRVPEWTGLWVAST